MGLLNEHLMRGLAVAIVSAALLFACIALIWRRMKTNLAWERGLARPLMLDGIRRAIQVHRARTGAWPSEKADLRFRVKVDARTLQTVGKWDIKLINAGRDGETARYSIMVKDSWEQWDTVAPPSHSPFEEGRPRKPRVVAPRESDA